MPSQTKICSELKILSSRVVCSNNPEMFLSVNLNLLSLVNGKAYLLVEFFFNFCGSEISSDTFWEIQLPQMKIR
jgi:hypothetical protein